MPNVLLTQKCVRRCPYCFASKHMRGANPDLFLSWEDFIYITDFIQNSGERHISLLGGEPTLHPNFVEYVLYLMERDFHVTVFTSGVMSPSTLDKTTALLSNIDPQRLGFVCNVNEPEKTPTSFAELEQLYGFLERFSLLVTCGFNIYRPDFSLEFIFQLIQKYGLGRHIRLGLAHPIPCYETVHIPITKFQKVAERLLSHVPLLTRLGIDIGLDCGFQKCLFNDTQIGQLFRVSRGNLKFGCGPAIDIGPDMMAWSCFPLASFHKKSVFEFDSIQSIHRYFSDLHKKVRVEVSGVFPECYFCTNREKGICSGGCIAHAISKFQNEARVRMPEVYI